MKISSHLPQFSFPVNLLEKGALFPAKLAEIRRSLEVGSAYADKWELDTVFGRFGGLTSQMTVSIFADRDKNYLSAAFARWSSRKARFMGCLSRYFCGKSHEIPFTPVPTLMATHIVRGWW